MSVLSSGRATLARLSSRAGALERVACNEVPLDIFRPRIVQQGQHGIDERADIAFAFVGDAPQQIEVLVPHCTTFAGAEPRVFAASAQPIYLPPPIRQLR